MSSSSRDLTHPSWHRSPEPALPPRESLMSQMVRAQLIFDRRTPPGGMPAWRDAEGDVTPIHVDQRIGGGAGEFLLGEALAEGVLVPPPGMTPMESVCFAEELAERLQLARDRVEAEHVHLTQVGTVADAYLGRPSLRLVK
jgi:hypothetical protein